MSPDHAAGSLSFPLRVSGDPQLYAGPALGRMNCFFVSVTGSDIQTPTLENLLSGFASSLSVGHTSPIYSRSELLSGVIVPDVPVGKNREIRIYGVVHPSGTCSSSKEIAKLSVFGEAVETRDIYLIGTATMPEIKLGTDSVNVKVTYDASTATNLTSSCRNVWRSITTTGAPEARDQPAGRINHTAIWTGSKMIVWGGFDSTYLNSGAIYVP